MYSDIQQSSKVSIIVPIYNVENFLDKLILSLINQTYKNLEIILVDDGSPDNSAAICDKYAQQDERIKIVHKKNEGAGVARNVGINMSTGEYMIFVDGDDWLETDCVSYMLQLIQQTSSDMAMPIKTFTSRNRIQTESDKIEIWDAEKAAYGIIFPIMPVGSWNKIYRSEMIKKNKILFPEKWGGEGLCFAFTAAQYANHVGIGRRKVYNYRLNNSDSALTHYRLSIGINVRTHIKMLKENLHLKTKRLINACNMHMWKNNFLVLKLLIATNAKQEYKDLYKECKSAIRHDFIDVIRNIECRYIGYSRFQTVKIITHMFVEALFPMQMIRKKLKKERSGLKKDRML